MCATDPNNPPMQSDEPPVPAEPATLSEPQGLQLDVREPASFDPKTYVAALPARPGIYRMLDAAGTIIYVGKAANLRAQTAAGTILSNPDDNRRQIGTQPNSPMKSLLGQ